MTQRKIRLNQMNPIAPILAAAVRKALPVVARYIATEAGKKVLFKVAQGIEEKLPEGAIKQFLRDEFSASGVTKGERKKAIDAAVDEAYTMLKTWVKQQLVKNKDKNQEQLLLKK